MLRLADVAFAFPAVLLAIMLTAVYGPGLLNAILAIGLFNIPVFVRVARASSAQVVWTRDFILAARISGKGGWRISLEHVLPNIAPALLVQATVQFAVAIFARSRLVLFWGWARSRRSSRGAECSARPKPSLASAIVGFMARFGDCAGGVGP